MQRNIAIRLPAFGAAILLAAVGLLSLPRSAAATVCAWTGAADTDWANAGNWTGCLVSPPGPSDAVVIDAQANQPVLASGTAANLSALTVNPGATLQVGGGLTTTDATLGGQISVLPAGLMTLNGGGMTISGTLGVASGGLAHFDLLSANTTVVTTGVLSGAGDFLLTTSGSAGRMIVYSSTNLGGLTLGKYGRAEFYAPAILSRLTMTDFYSVLQGTGDVTVTQAMSWTNGNLAQSGTLVISPGAILTVDSPGTVHVGGTQLLHNFGTMNWLRGGLHSAAPNFVNEPGGVFNLLGDMPLDAGFNNYGALNVVSGTISNFGVANFAGAVTLSGGNLGAGLSIFGGTLAGSGVITGNVVNYGGTIAPGNPLGAITVNGVLVEQSSGTLSFDLGGTVPGVGYDVLNINGQAQLGGALVISQTNGFLANAGDVFSVMNYTSLAPYTHFITITNPISITHPATIYNQHVIVAASPLQTRLSVRPNQPLSGLSGSNGYTVSAFNPTPFTVTVHNITDTLAAGFTYLPGTTTGATTAEPNLSLLGGQQVLVWPGLFTLAPTTGITVNFGISVAVAQSGTYLNSAAVDANVLVTDTRQVAVDGVAPVIVFLPVSDNISISAPGVKVQPTSPPQLLFNLHAAAVPITVIARITCPFASCGAIQNVFLVHGPVSYTMTLISGTVSSLAPGMGGPASAGGSYGFWKGTIPGQGVIPGQPIRIFPDWDDHHPCIGPGPTGCVPGDPGPGTPGLYDPSGFVTDANTGLPISGASVTLYRAPALQPDTRTQTLGCPTVNTRPGGMGGSWDSLPPADIGVGTLEDPLFSPAQIDPAVNPQLTDDQGHFGWNVVAGCWFVSASAAGYATKISPLVGVPPEVTDLNFALQPVAPQFQLYLPIVLR